MSDKDHLIESTVKTLFGAAIGSMAVYTFMNRNKPQVEEEETTEEQTNKEETKQACTSRR